MSKLHQVVAVESSEKTRFERSRTDLYKKLQKTALFEGRNRTYQPRDDDGERYPDENQEVQLTAEDSIDLFKDLSSRLIDLTATKDWGNSTAFADVVIGDQVLIKDAPIPFLLFLEKQLEHFETFVRHIPTLDRARRWTFDQNTGLYETDPETRVSTKKLQRPIVMYDATEHHPAQTQLITEDVVVGSWTEKKFHGGVTERQRDEWLERIADLRIAVKRARCDANDVEVEQKRFGKKLFDYVFEG